MQDRITSHPTQAAWLLPTALALAVLLGLGFYVLGVRQGQARDAASRKVEVEALRPRLPAVPPGPGSSGAVVVEELPYAPRARIQTSTPPAAAPPRPSRPAPREEPRKPTPPPVPAALPSSDPDGEPARDRDDPPAPDRGARTAPDRHEPAREERREPGSGSEAAPAEEDVIAVLRRYERTMAARDLDAHMDLYAPRLDRWFLKRGVSAATIREQKRDDWASLRETTVKFRDVRVRFSAQDRADVGFTKSWVLAGPRRWTGELRGTMELRRANGAWRIVSERDRQVLWQRRS